MRKLKKEYIVILLFCIMIGSPYLIWTFASKYVDIENYENRELAKKPEIKWENRYSYSTEMENYVNDYLPFRNQMIRLNSAIRYYIFHSSADDRVLPGKDGWLFYSNVKDNDPIGNYKGENLFTDEELELIAQNMITTRDNLAAEGCEFVLFIAPNKERVYSEKMPDYLGEPAEMYAALQVVEYLRDNTDIRVVYPYEELIAAKEKIEENIILYYKTDTHWNSLGAYIGTVELMKELGVEMPDILSEEIKIEKTYVLGDLADMLNLSGMIDLGKAYAASGYDTHEMENIKWDFLGEVSYQCKNADPRKLFIYRDSFCSAMAEIIGSQFNESYMLHYQAYTDSDIVREQKPDIFVYEVVERGIKKLKYFVYE